MDSEMDSTEELRTVIDEKLKGLEAQKLELHRARNKLLAINSRVPVELLADIFCYTIPLKSDGTRLLHVCENDQQNCKRRTHAVTQVCSHWRAVALSTPWLWIQCLPYDPAGVKTYLDRSAGLPMVLDISFNRRSWESVRLLLAQLPRAKGLRISLRKEPVLPANGIPGLSFSFRRSTDIEAKEEFERTLEMLPQSLEFLTICGTWSQRNERPIPYVAAGVDEDLDRFPNLRHLYVSNALIDPNCCLFRNLRTLVLNGCSSGLLRISGDQLVGILQACPEIGKLQVIDVYWTQDLSVRPIPEHTVHLPRLRSAYLSVDGSDVDVALKILHGFRFSEEAKLCIAVDDTFEEFREPEFDEVTIQMLLEVASLTFRQLEKLPWQLGVACNENHAAFFGSVYGSSGDTLHIGLLQQTDTDSRFPIS
jgi:hypothetical protein